MFESMSLIPCRHPAYYKQGCIFLSLHDNALHPHTGAAMQQHV